MDKNTVCFTTVANGRYCDYVPLYIYFITKAYPDDFIRVYIQGAENKRLLEQVNRFVRSDNWSVIFNYRNEYPKDRFTLGALRFLIFDEIIESFPYTYVGDVDILIAKENVPLVEQHKKHCDFLKLPYSNIIRRHSDKRLTGLHFIKSPDYYNQVRPYTEKYLALLKTGNAGFRRDDEILYAMCSDAGILPAVESESNTINDYTYSPLTYDFRPHHGLHLNSFRGSLFADDGAAWCKSNEGYKVYLRAVKNFYDNDVANLVNELHPSIQLQIKRMLEC